MPAVRISSRASCRKQPTREPDVIPPIAFTDDASASCSASSACFGHNTSGHRVLLLSYSTPVHMHAAVATLATGATAYITLVPAARTHTCSSSPALIPVSSATCCHLPRNQTRKRSHIIPPCENWRSYYSTQTRQTRPARSRTALARLPNMTRPHARRNVSLHPVHRMSLLVPEKRRRTRIRPQPLRRQAAGPTSERSSQMTLILMYRYTDLVFAQ